MLRQNVSISGRIGQVVEKLVVPTVRIGRIRHANGRFPLREMILQSKKTSCRFSMKLLF